MFDTATVPTYFLAYKIHQSRLPAKDQFNFTPKTLGEARGAAEQQVGNIVVLLNYCIEYPVPIIRYCVIFPRVLQEFCLFEEYFW
jgi:hypothetical protein